MGDRCRQSNEEQRKKLAEEFWLCYFNRVLLARGLITQSEHNRMTSLIASRPLRRPPCEEGSTKKSVP